MAKSSITTDSRNRIFVCYRRSDGGAAVGRLVHDLGKHFPNNEIFWDATSIDPGEVFEETLKRELESCAVMLVIIGERWLEVKDKTGRRRLDDPEDWVVREIAVCLLRGGVPVIPVLIDVASMPEKSDLPESVHELTRRHFHQIQTRRWPSDVDELVGVLQRLPALQKQRTRRHYNRWGIIVAIGIAIVFGLLMMIIKPNFGSPDEDQGNGQSSLGRDYLDAKITKPPLPYNTEEVDAVVNGNSKQWVDTRVELSRDMRYRVETSGEIRLQTSGALIDANGDSQSPSKYPNQCIPFVCGVLVGRLGPTGEPFEIGKAKVLSNLSGRLYVAVWDPCNPLNNEGKFIVSVEPID